jgi:hypothetical protein
MKTIALFEIHLRVVAEPQNAAVEHAQQQTRHGWRGLFDFVEQHQRKPLLSLATEVSFCCVSRLRFAMPQISGRRADQFGDLVLHLEFAAIDFQQVLRAAVQRFGERFHSARLAGAGGTQQQEHADGPVFGRQAGLKHLDIRDNYTDYVRLSPTNGMDL